MWGESMINMSKLKMPKLKMNKRAFILTAGNNCFNFHNLYWTMFYCKW